MTDQTAKANEASDFLIAHAGPFYELQSRLNLLHRHNLAAGRRAALFAAIAWLPLALLSLVRAPRSGTSQSGPSCWISAPMRASS